MLSEAFVHEAFLDACAHGNETLCKFMGVLSIWCMTMTITGLDTIFGLLTIFLVIFCGRMHKKAKRSVQKV